MEYSNGLFVCYAPYDEKKEPEVCIAICIERGEWGKKTIDIAKKLLMAYYGVSDPEGDAPVKMDAPLGDVSAKETEKAPDQNGDQNQE